MTASTGSAPAVPPVTPALRAQAARQPRRLRVRDRPVLRPRRRGSPVRHQLPLLVADVALALSGHHLEAGNPAPALDALDTALTNAPADERLWNELLRAARATGDTARLESTAAALVARHHEIGGGARGLPPRTEALLDTLLPAWREAQSATD